ncbi:unnamed protein product [Echinostoma caproni]|uniref:Kinesin motor domain-containing protein n=1 Tax=Echinostoma caproni TaxID=27848 RepID=A0A183ABE0_9TREM|nr:unnamed protein product [Echinostoma caproni]
MNCRKFTNLFGSGGRRGNPPAPKQFTFDAVLTKEVAMTGLCSLAITDTIRAVLRGQDGCILTIGHKRTGKSYTMFGSDRSMDGIGVIPCAIAWLFQLLSRQRDSEGIRFSVRVSAVEIYGTEERFQDLLSDAALTMGDDISLETYPPSHYLASTNKPRSSQGDSSRSDGDSVATCTVAALTKRSELRASSADKAAHLLDVALAHRACVRDRNQSSGLSHMLFTLHIYQCRVEQNEHGTSVSGGRTRLHFLDLGCGRYTHHTSSIISMGLDQRKQSRTRSVRPSENLSEPGSPETRGLSGPDPNNANQSTRCLSLSAMANVLLALLTGQRHLPFRDSALTYILREAMSGNQVQPCILAHVSSSTQHYTETLQASVVVQLAAKLSRLRRRRVGVLGSGVHLAESYASSPSESTSLDDTASSSVEGASQSTGRRERLYRRRYKGPRMGRSSYARSVSSLGSDLDFTSGSEQSCETVIYLGNHGSSYTGTNDPRLVPGWSQIHSGTREHRPIRRLGPRGTADGSVDMPGDVLGQKMFSEYMNSAGTCPTVLEDAPMERRSSSGSGQNTNHLSIGPVKRMMPRTNATVWPRSVSFRKAKECLDTNTETWVDGPKAMVTMCSTPVVTSDNPLDHAQTESHRSKLSIENASQISAKMEEATPMGIGLHETSTVGFVPSSEHWNKEDWNTQSITPSAIDTRLTIPSIGVPNYTESPSSIDEAFALLAHYPSTESTTNKWDLSKYRLLSLNKSGTSANGACGASAVEDNLFSLDVPDSLCQSASSSSTLERDVGLLPRALSDISERTEETEGLPDCATMPKKQTGSTMFAVKSQTQPNSCAPCLRSNSLEPVRSVYPTEASLKLMELRKQIRSASGQSHEEQPVTVGSSALPVDYTRNLSLNSSSSTANLATAPIPISSSPMVVSGSTSMRKNQLYSSCTNSVAENTSGGAMPAKVSEQNKGPEPNGTTLSGRGPNQDCAAVELSTFGTNSPNPRKETQIRKTEESKASSGVCAPAAKPTAPHHRNSHVTGGNSLLRVAAWVNSIGLLNSEQSAPGEASGLPYTDSVALSPERPVCTNESWLRHPSGPTDLSPELYPHCMVGMSTFGRTFNSPKSDRIQLRRSSINTNLTTTTTTSASPARQNNVSQNTGLVHRNCQEPYNLSAPNDSIDIRFRGPHLVPTVSPIRIPSASDRNPGETESTNVTGPFVSSIEEPKDKRKSRLRFLTLPLFRGLRIRHREKKTKKDKSSWTAISDEGSKSPDIQPAPFASTNSPPNDPISYSPCAWFASTHSGSNNDGPQATPLDTFRPCVGLSTEAYQQLSPARQTQLLVSRSEAYMPCPQSVGERPGHGWIENRAILSEQNRFRECHMDSGGSCASPSHFNPPGSPSWHMKKYERDPLPNDLPNSSAGPMSAVCYNNHSNSNMNNSNNQNTGGLLLASVYRSGRRSVTGGAASSGYESMRFGASDLSSLSHPDSASDCSGLVPSRLISLKDTSGCALCTDSTGPGRRCHGTVGRIHGSTGSIGQISSPNGHMRSARNSSQRAKKPKAAATATAVCGP